VDGEAGAETASGKGAHLFFTSDERADFYRDFGAVSFALFAFSSLWAAAHVLTSPFQH
jgi:hypothetical protein